jgi:hypothetical protein
VTEQLVKVRQSDCQAIAAAELTVLAALAVRMDLLLGLPHGGIIVNRLRLQA